jgi:hypothetical protein
LIIIDITSIYGDSLIPGAAVKLTAMDGQRCTGAAPEVLVQRWCIKNRRLKWRLLCQKRTYALPTHRTGRCRES